MIKSGNFTSLKVTLTHAVPFYTISWEHLNMTIILFEYLHHPMGTPKLDHHPIAYVKEDGMTSAFACLWVDMPFHAKPMYIVKARRGVFLKLLVAIVSHCIHI